MKSKLVMLVSISALTFSGISAMAAGKPAQGNLRGPVAVSQSAKGITATASARMSLANATKASSSAPISHTVNGGKASARLSLSKATKGSSSAPISHTVNGN